MMSGSKWKTLCSICMCMATLYLLPAVSNAASITSLRANSNTIGKYDRYELKFGLTGVSPANYNPFRPETFGDALSPAGVDVWAEITTPSGKAVRVSGFWDVDFDYLGQVGDYGEGWGRYDKFVPASDPYWKVRYAPSETGTYKVRVYAKDVSGTTSSSEQQFTCSASNLKGIIKVASDGERLAYSNGDPFIAMGASMKDETGLQNTYLPKLKENGMNFVRRWLVNGNYGDIHKELTPQSWILSGATFDSSTKRTGDRSVAATVTGPRMFIQEQFVGIRNASNYNASVWLRTSSNFNGTAAVRVVVYYTDGTRKTLTGNTIGSNSGWAQSSLKFSTYISGKTADFVDYRVDTLSGSTGTVWADDASLYETDAGGAIKYNWNYLWSPSFEKWNPSQLKIQALWRAERLLSLSEQYGIAVQLCIFDYRMWNEINPIGFYSNFFGDFWTDPASTAQQDRVLRHLAARFGAYRSVFAWELTNEGDPTYTSIRGKWIADRARCLRANDPQGHMITNSYWTSPGDERFTQLSEIDVNQVHFYLNTEERGNKGQGVPTWWDQPSGVVIDKTASNAHSGTSSLKFTANGSNLGEGQSVYLKPGKSYTLRYWLKTSSVSGTSGAILRFYSPEDVEVMKSVALSTSGTTAYTKREIAFTTASNVCRAGITLQLTGSSGTAWFDDVQVIDNSTGRDVFYNGGIESPKFGDDEYEWAVYNTYLVRQMSESGPNGTRKPWVSGEFGLMGLNANLSGWADPTSSFARHDTTGIHIHNCIWAQFMASSAVHTPSYWWIKEYILAYDLLGVWKGLTTFSTKLPFYTRGESIASEPYFADVPAKSSNSNIRVLGQRKSNAAYLWVQNAQYSWSRVIRAGINPSAVSADITIPGFTNGTYEVRWYNTDTGMEVKSETETVSAGTLTLSVSSLSEDLGVIIKPTSTTGTSNISMQMTADKTAVKPAETITYTITYKNNGADSANNVSVSLPIPVNTSYVTGSASTGGVHDAASNSVQWKITSIAPGATGQVKALVKVN